MTDSFKCIYEIDDGYVGSSRPQSFTISVDDLEDEEDYNSIFHNMMQEDFEQNIYPYPKNLDKFLEWADQKSLQKQK
jgi:hypothetical protein